MKLVKYHPWRPLNTFSSLFDELAGGGLNHWLENDSNWSSKPSVNIKETDKDYSIELAAPGLEKSDFQVEVKDDQLKIKVEKKAEHKEESEDYRRREFSYTSFSRSFYLPKDVRAEEIAAEYVNGILMITIPKHAEVDLVKKIEIG